MEETELAELAPKAPRQMTPPLDAALVPQVAMHDASAAAVKVSRGGCSNLKALMRVRLTHKKREWGSVIGCCGCNGWCPCAMVCEIIFPLLLVFGLAYAKMECVDGGTGVCIFTAFNGWGGRMPTSFPGKGTSTTCVPGLELDANSQRTRGSGETSSVSTCPPYTNYYYRGQTTWFDVQSMLSHQGRTLALAYDDPADKPKVEAMRAWISKNWYPRTTVAKFQCDTVERRRGAPTRHFDADGVSRNSRGTQNCSAHTKQLGVRTASGGGGSFGVGDVHSFAETTAVYTAAELEKYTKSTSYGEGGRKLLWGAIVFHSIPDSCTSESCKPGGSGKWDYSIRLNSTKGSVPGSSNPAIEPGLRTQPNRAKSTNEAYMEQGFVTTQLLVDRFIIGDRNGKLSTAEVLQMNGIKAADIGNATQQGVVAEHLRYAPHVIDMMALPYDGQIYNIFLSLIKIVLPLLLILTFLYTQKKVLNELIVEKETKMRETLRTMGIPSWTIIGSWFITYALVFGGICAFFALISTSGVSEWFALFEFSSMTFIFVLFFSWCMAFVGYAFAIHTLFNNARTGGLVGVLTMFAQWVVFATSITATTAPNVISLLALFPNVAISIALSMICDLEVAQIGARWSDAGTVSGEYGYSMLSIVGTMVFSTFFWTVLGWYLDQVLPKEFGIVQPCWFIFDPSYWIPAKFEPIDHMAEGSKPGNVPYEDAGSEVKARSKESGVSISIQGLTKKFGHFTAVDDLNLTMYEGQIFCLLGHNGAGKTTTINMLSGMCAPTEGTAFIMNKDVRTDMTDIRDSVGLCPQHDVLWGDLTVQEHMEVFSVMKNGSVVQGEIDQLLTDVGLYEKQNTRADSLSGGQRRKLSLCGALMGDAKVIFLDEPTSGMDPYSRRSTWNMLQNYREGRVMILTTHFMDEADLLGDRIAIMADGKLCCCGSSLFLKNQFGAGYHLTIAKKIGDESKTDAIIEMARKWVPMAEMISDVGAEVTILLPTDSSGAFADLFDEFDANLEALHMEQYGISQVTMEEVFLKVAHGRHHDGEDDMVSDLVNSGSQNEDFFADVDIDTERSEAAIFGQHLNALLRKRFRYGTRDITNLCCILILPVVVLWAGLALISQPISDQISLTTNLAHYKLAAGVDVPFLVDPAGAAKSVQFAQAVQAQSSKPNDLVGLSKTEFNGTKMVYGSTYINGMPGQKTCANTAGIFCGFFPQTQQIIGLSGEQLSCSTDYAASQSLVGRVCDNGKCIAKCSAQDDYEGIDAAVVLNTCNQSCVSTCAMTPLIAPLLFMLKPCKKIQELCEDTCGKCPAGSPYKMAKVDVDPIAPVPSLTIANTVLELGRKTDLSNVIPAAVSFPNMANGATSAVIMYNSTAIYAIPTYLNLVNDAIKRSQAGNADSSITVRSHPFPISYHTKSAVSSIVAIFACIFVIIAFAFVPAAVIAYIVRERESHHNSKHQQYISGVSIPAYWLSNYIYDLTTYAFSVVCTLAIIEYLEVAMFEKDGALSATVTIFIAFGLSSISLSYLISFVFERHQQAQLWNLMLNLLCGLILMLASFIMALIPASRETNDALIPYYRMVPSFCLGNSLLRVSINQAIDVDDARHKDYFDDDVAGTDLRYMFVCAPVFFVATILLDMVLNTPSLANRIKRDPARGNAEGVIKALDLDVMAEKERVKAGGANDEAIMISDMVKTYKNKSGGPAKTAVDGLNFGIAKGECFGFLGINGAGKSSTLNILTGAILPSEGDALLAGKSILTEQKAIRRELGFCPQHDALLDLLTVREHLELFGRIKGIRAADLAAYVQKMMVELDLKEHEFKNTNTLSGGNKRKLSVAIALMGSPKLVFMDEPSTGVDPAARRFMWSVISRLCTEKKDSTVVLTTHNMEEAEALCTRVGVMVDGQLSCLGSNQHLKARFGQGYQLELKLCEAADGATAATVAQFRLGDTVDRDELAQVCANLGDPNRVTLVAQGNHEGLVIYRAIDAAGAVDAETLVEWFTLGTQAAALQAFLATNFPGTQLLERHGHQFRFKLPGVTDGGKAVSISNVFRQLEANQAALNIEEYGVSQTSLEQIFNQFAAAGEDTAKAPELGVVAP